MNRPTDEPIAMTFDQHRLCAEVKRLEWASQIPEDVIEEIAESAERLQVNSGDVLVSIDALCNRVYFVIEGRLEGVLSDRLDKELHRETFGRGSVVGLFSLLAPGSTHLQLTAVEPTTLIQFPLEEVLNLAARHRQFQLAMLTAAANLVKRLVVADRDLPKPAVVGIIHHRDASRHATIHLARRLRQLGETVCVTGDRVDWPSDDGIPYEPLYQNGRLIESDQVVRILKQWSSHGRLLIDLSNDHSQEDLRRLLNYSEIVLWCIQPADTSEAIQSLRVLEQDAPRLCEKIRIVWDLSYDEPVPPYSADLHELSAGDFKTYRGRRRPHQGRLLEQGLERIIHHLRGVQIGMALGGGAARGMAHLGVLKCLEQHGIYIDRLAGTSAGAMTGTVYAAGMAPEFATQCFKSDLEPGWLFRRVPAGGYWYLLYKYRFNQFESMLRKYLQHWRMEQLVIPMTTIAVDLVDGAALARQSGDATNNILESINLPPLAMPIVNQAQAIVDGGLLNNVPANMLVAQGCNFVIASTVTAKLDKDFMSIRSKAATRRRRHVTSIQVIMRQQMIQNHSMNAVGVQPADFVIAPDVTAFDISEFTRAEEMSVIGEATTNESICRLKSMLAKLDPALFTSKASFAAV
ncbi:MAG: patatin-like phospholipase family protein [Planctomycetaceae bacterium]